MRTTSQININQSESNMLLNIIIKALTAAILMIPAFVSAVKTKPVLKHNALNKVIELPVKTGSETEKK